MIGKKCAICGEDNLVSENIQVSDYMVPNSQGAKLYFDLWHFNIEKCGNCGYASKDITSCINDKIKYIQVPDEKILKDLNDARNNQVSDYMCASKYYELIGDIKNQALCLIQAGDAVYNEIIYWKENILTEDELGHELYSFGEELYLKGTYALKKYISQSPDDIDMQILLAGVLSDSKDKHLGYVMLQKLKKLKLSNNQQIMIEFLENEIY